jgi:GntR family transcriptional regulator
MMIAWRLDGGSGVPPYLQVAQQVRQAIVAGVLRPGDQLPTVKEVVAVLAINPNTVFKGYRELEHEGLVAGRPGAGTFVLRRPPGPSLSTQAALTRGLVDWVDRARDAGLDDRSIEGLLRQVLDHGSAAATA